MVPARTSIDHNSVCPLLPVDIVLVILAVSAMENSNEEKKKYFSYPYNTLCGSICNMLPMKNVQLRLW
jgi:hypothetical protein